jgi:predicted transcriptional regulator
MVNEILIVWRPTSIISMPKQSELVVLLELYDISVAIETSSCSSGPRSPFTLPPNLLTSHRDRAKRSSGPGSTARNCTFLTPIAPIGCYNDIHRDVYRSTRMTMQRTNIYLDEDQVRALKHLAAEHEQSVAELVRQAVDNYLAQEFDNDEVWQQRMSDLVKRLRDRNSPEATSAEVEADVSLAREEVRTARRAARSH